MSLVAIVVVIVIAKWRRYHQYCFLLLHLTSQGVACLGDWALLLELCASLRILWDCRLNVLIVTGINVASGK